MRYEKEFREAKGAKELDIDNDADVSNYSKFLEELIEQRSREKEELKRDMDNGFEKAKEWVLECVSNIRAVEILFGVMADAGTHRQKELFADMATKQCEKIRIELTHKVNSAKINFWHKGGELPF